jgi:hypothetical protein
MNRFNLEEYETVEERIRKFYESNPDGRIITENKTTIEDRTVSTWVVFASVFLTAADQSNNLPKATGWAFEIDGGNGANKTAALENAETSAIGRALANAGLSGNKRTTREEMTKVERGVTPQPVKDWEAEAARLTTKEELRELWNLAKRSKATPATLEKIKRYAVILGEASADA